MNELSLSVHSAELRPLLNLTHRVGSDPLLTQASTGNSSAKLGETLWIKASGKWMADAISDDIFIPLDLAEVMTECLQRQVDPAGRHRGASLETAMHAVLPHKMVLHAHCVNTIAWAVRSDGPVQLRELLAGLRWQWIPCAASGLPLAEAVRRAVLTDPATDVFVLANHGLVVCGEDSESIDELLAEVRRRVAIPPRKAHPADYAALWELSRESNWCLPDDDDIHALGTDTIARRILTGGFLYPCQAIFSGPERPELFYPIPYYRLDAQWQHRYGDWPFLIVEGRGVLLRSDIAPADLAMISGLAQVVQRLGATAPLRYLTAPEIGGIPGEAALRYRDLASAGRR